MVGFHVSSCKPLVKRMEKRVTYTGTNYDEIQSLCGDRVLAPYFCMGFSMLSVMTEEGFESVNEGDTVVLSEDGNLCVEK